jgi:hypothetical protein
VVTPRIFFLSSISGSFKKFLLIESEEGDEKPGDVLLGVPDLNRDTAYTLTLSLLNDGRLSFHGRDSVPNEILDALRGSWAEVARG